ncbi:16S rRNA (cytosine(1402)-N(4))-methyltransferase RsmH [Myxococcota bacterium]|nr:16S rRNA (cytosine(1402)-N(4))-methyltransferase RsmH [Myxococcota bacterium]MBU1379515.1 16S rRNA (cytosine(1402)-N(4))-methyltransferase RsmH [Myxococcota bacterium]MBU1498185.1 16S rRNA (cytosine(1402)-N(4))-methyltransferase RsmH [Myxococcota bacterium]
MEYNHISVLYNEIKSLVTEMPPLAVAVDATVGGGGHSNILISHLKDGGIFLGFDKDPDAVENFQEKFGSSENISLIQRSFSCLKEELESREIKKVDFILADLGVSSHQIDTADRGFSFMKSGPLDMRMDTSCGMTALELLENTTEKELTYIFRTFGEEPQGAKIARGVLAALKDGKVTDTLSLAKVIGEIKKVPPWKTRINPATKCFQALRIAVNGELDDLEILLKDAPGFLAPGGIFAVITFHSLEDRLVKHRFHDLAHPEKFVPEHVILTKDQMPKADFKAPPSITPGDEEETANSRSRSSRLRILRRLENEI